jgi:hypothetical protein
MVQTRQNPLVAPSAALDGAIHTGSHARISPNLAVVIGEESTKDESQANCGPDNISPIHFRYWVIRC